MNKVLIVTGGGRGIGAAVCRMGAERGMDVCVNYVGNREGNGAVVSDAVHLEDVFPEVQSNCRDIHGGAPFLAEDDLCTLPHCATLGSRSHPLHPHLSSQNPTPRRQLSKLEIITMSVAGIAAASGLFAAGLTLFRVAFGG